MIDTKIIRENPELIKINNQSRNVHIDVDAILELDKQRRTLQAQFDEKRAAQKALSKDKPSEEDFTTLKQLKAEVKQIEEQQKNIEQQLHELLIQLPNINTKSTPIGKGEHDNVEIRKAGNPKTEGKPHEELGKELGLFDIERGAKVSGNRFWYLKGNAVRLQCALVNYVLLKLTQKGFTPMITPHLVREQVLFGVGFLPTAKSEIYHVNPDEDDLYLIGTSEAPLVAYHSDEIIDVNQPIRYCGYSPCYRREAGAYGKDTTGILRGHQFDKIEMVSFTKPEQSDAEHQFLLSIEEEILEELEIPYQLMQQCSGDMSPQAAECYDFNAWLPGQQTYREITSCSNTTDYQARRLNIRYKTQDGLAFVHTLNGTGVAIGRTIIALLENHQQSDGSIKLPAALHSFFGGESILP